MGNVLHGEKEQIRSYYSISALSTLMIFWVFCHIFSGYLGLLHHTAHSAACRHCRCVFLDVGNNGFCGEECGSNAGCILQSASCNLSGIKDACLDHIHIFFFQHIKAYSTLRLPYLIYNHAAL